MAIEIHASGIIPYAFLIVSAACIAFGTYSLLLWYRKRTVIECDGYLAAGAISLAVGLYLGIVVSSLLEWVVFA